MAKNDRQYGQALWKMCAEDPLFFINTFVYTYDPRKSTCPVVPFITYPFQDIAILELINAIGDHDLLAEKSRDMGATWCFLYGITWFFLFKNMQTFLAVSRKEDLVDKTQDPDCLFWKIDFMIENLPWFIKPPRTRNKLHMFNENNGSTIDGSSTTGDVGRGGRRTAVFLDEFASVEEGHAVLKATRDMTTCRLFNSTPKGTNNAFYDMTQTDILKLRFHWTEHPEKSAGLYTSGDDDQLEIIDSEYWRFKKKSDFDFIRDGNLRSPWYDLQCSRAAHPMEIAQELDIDYLGSAFQFFDPGIIDGCIKKDSRPAFHIGELSFDESLEPTEFISFM